MRLASLVVPLATAALAAVPPQRPHLVLVVSVDQGSAELMSRWAGDLPGGLGRLLRDGTDFVDAYQDHGFTETGPGHSVILSGRHPMNTGIVENVWLDRGLGRDTYCVEDPAGRLLSGPGTPAGPAHLRTGTLGEWLTAQVPGSRSFAMTGKDRSAILMAGHKANGVYWFNGPGGFTTSAAYATTLPGWLMTYNAAFLDRVEHASLFWSPLEDRGLPAPASYRVHDQTVTLGLPRAVHAVGMPLDAPFWGRFRASPFLDEAILGAAEALVEAEKVGQGPGTDLLALGLSATDYVGHRFGNGGPEMLDQLRRLDRNLGVFLDRLRARVPDLWVVLTADHGATDCPERLQAQGIPARRLDLRAWTEAFNRDLGQRLGVAQALFRPSHAQQLWLDEAALKQSGRSRAQVLDAALALAKGRPEVAEACTAAQLGAMTVDPQESPAQRSYATRLKLSFAPDRSGDLLIAFRPFYIIDDPADLAGHGSPQDYDRRVPLVFWGPWKAERRSEPVRVIDLAPTLAAELAVRPGNAVDGRALELRRK